MMLRLPSGQIVGILSERARFHAEQKQIRPTKQTEHHALYPLVDVIFPLESHRSTPLKAFEFSGHTLADHSWLRRWPEADRAAFARWLKEPPQRQEIERARQRIECRVLPERVHRVHYAGRLYSSLKKHIQALPQLSAPPQQWKKTILKLRQQGIREDEITWSGIIPFLDDAIRLGKVRVKKGELLHRIDFSDLQLEMRNEMQREGGCGLDFIEVAKRLGDAEIKRSGMSLGQGDMAIVRYLEPQRRYRIGVIWRQGRALSAAEGNDWFLLDPHGRAITNHASQSYRFSDRQQAEEVANANACQLCMSRAELRFASTYEYLSLDGGEEYREWIVTLPHYSRSFFGGHYFDRNILLHIRSKFRHDEQGRKLLFIEEIQSDWHQTARKYGYGAIAQAPFRNEWLLLALKLMLIHAAESRCEGISWADGNIQQARYGKEMGVLRRIYDHKLPKLLRRLTAASPQQIGFTHIESRKPWLKAERIKQRWRVTDGRGRFRTQARYSLDEAHRLITRHSKKAQLKVPLFLIPSRLRDEILNDGLPLFGYTPNYKK